MICVICLNYDFFDCLNYDFFDFYDLCDTTQIPGLLQINRLLDSYNNLIFKVF